MNSLLYVIFCKVSQQTEMKDCIDCFPFLNKQNITKLYLNALIYLVKRILFLPTLCKKKYKGGEPCNVATVLIALGLRRDPTWLGGTFTAWQRAAELIMAT